MNWYSTTIKAIDPMTGEMQLWQGPDVPGITFTDAQQRCIDGGRGYLEVESLIHTKNENVPEPINYNQIRYN